MGILDALVKRFGGLSAVEMEHIKVRAAYLEPRLTEDEQRREAEKKQLCSPVVPYPIRCIAELLVRCFIKDKKFTPQTIEAKCWDCDVPVHVDARWRSIEKGGMEGAICPRCKKVVLGVL